MTWILLSTISYFLNALVAIIDKFLISKKIPEPIVYTFYIGILSIFSLILIPFGKIFFPSFSYLVISFITGILFMVALFSFFKSLKNNESSRVIPLIGTLTTIFSIFLSLFILDEKLSKTKILAIIFLLSGSLIISLIKKEKKSFISDWFYVFSSSLFFSISFVLSKIIYSNLSFINGFIWIRIGSFIFAFFLLLFPKIKKMIIDSLKETKQEVSLLFLSNQGISAVAFLILNLAIFFGSVSLVNALQGLQYVFILLISILISKKYPSFLKEEIKKEIIFQKGLAILLIVIGFFILSFF
jgi:drug/metabolite transporter (DMT)-like permease